MFPGIYDFHWDVGHVVFLGIFYSVILSVFFMLARSLFRARRLVRSGEADVLRWHEDFETLPADRRACRHALTGVAPGRSCGNGFDCRTCAESGALARRATQASAENPPGPGDVVEVQGLPFPTDRLYHRGHTWVRPEPDGTVVIGLDAFAQRLLGRAEPERLPEPGRPLKVGGEAWAVRTDGRSVRILSPVDGAVVARGGPEDPWILRVRPESPTLDERHLLRPSEVPAWMLREVERLQLAVTGAGTGAALADGGVLTEDLHQAVPAPVRAEVLGDLLIDP